MTGSVTPERGGNHGRHGDRPPGARPAALRWRSPGPDLATSRHRCLLTLRPLQPLLPLPPARRRCHTNTCRTSACKQARSRSFSRRRSHIRALPGSSSRRTEASGRLHAPSHNPPSHTALRPPRVRRRAPYSPNPYSPGAAPTGAGNPVQGLAAHQLLRCRCGLWRRRPALRPAPSAARCCGG